MKKKSPGANNASVCVTTAEKCLEEAAGNLAARLDLPLCLPPNGRSYLSHDFALHLERERLVLRKINDPQLTGAVYADFSRLPVHNRRGVSKSRRIRGGHDLLLKAVIGKRKTAPSVLDATGGLGRDAFLLAVRGCRVRLMERSPIIAALTADGLQRAARIPAVRDVVARLSLVQADSLNHLKNMQGEKTGPEVIYLDPMFPHRKKKARSKKQLLMLQHLIGHDDDADRLLEAALQICRLRVVVKRSRHSPCLGGLPPSFQYRGRSTRFDVYLAAR